MPSIRPDAGAPPPARRPASRRAAAVPLAAGGPLAFALLAFAPLACGPGERGAGPDRDAPARLAVAASVQATTATAVDVRATYPGVGGPAELARRTIPLTESPSQEVPLALDLAPCLAMVQGSAACPVSVELQLMRDATVLDRQVAGPFPMTPGAVVTMPQPVALHEVSAVHVTAAGNVARVEIGESVALTAAARDRTGAAVAGRTFAWTSSNPAVLRVDAATGAATGVAPGAATVRAAGGGRTGELALTVTPPSVRTLTITPATVQLAVGQAQTLAVEARDARGGLLAGRTFAFASSAPAVATAAASGAGLAVTGVAPGTATITASSAEGPNGTTVTAQATVTVLAAPSIRVAPASLAFQWRVGDPQPAAQTVTVSNGGGGSLGTLTARAPERPEARLRLELPAGGVGALVVTPIVSGPAGTYQLPITITSSVAGVAPVTVPVTVTVLPPAGPTGTLAGRVVSASGGGGIAGATVDLVTGGRSVARATTGSDGTWSAAQVPQGSYRVDVSAPGFVATSVLDQSLGGPAGVVETVPLAPTATTPGTLAGAVLDATRNQPIVGTATVELRAHMNARTGAAVATTTSGSGGAFTIAGVPAGTYTLTVRAPDYTEASRTVAVVGGTTRAQQDVFLSPTGAVGLVRVVLTWGDVPEDLDSHLTGPTAAGGRFHVFFASEGSCAGEPFACLDVDVTEGRGPETITIAQQRPGVYRYSVHNFTEAPSITTSGARVDVYAENRLLRTFNVPTAGTGLWWHVFELENGVVREINTIDDQLPAATAVGGTPVGAAKRAARRAASAAGTGAASSPRSTP